MKYYLRFFLCISFSLCSTLYGQEFILDANTSAIVHFNDISDHVVPELPTDSNSNTFDVNGIAGSAASFYSNNNTTFAADDNIDSGEGTVEAWVRPDWLASGPETRVLFSWGISGGILIEKDGGSYFKVIINRFGSDPAGNEISVGVNVSTWAQQEWHHIACTWSSTAVQLYIDGVLVNEAIPAYNLPDILANDFFIGSDNNAKEWTGLVDELRISKTQRTATEILDSYNSQGEWQQHDENSTLILHFENTMVGEVQESASISSGLSYGNGVYDKAGYFNGDEDLQYNATNNIKSDEGSFEIWVKPSFDPQPSTEDYTVLGWGAGGGILIFINQGALLRLITNRYGIGGNVEIGLGHNVADWNANEWHHIACTWSSLRIEMYVDGAKVSETTTNFDLPTLPQQQFHIGSDAGFRKWDGYLDELRISENVRSEDEIFESFLNGIDITGLSLKENNITVYPHWRYKPEVCLSTSTQTFEIGTELLDWTSSNNFIATVNTNGIVEYHNPSNVSLTGTLEGQSVQLNSTVLDPILDPVHPQLDNFLVTPANCYKEEMKVLIISYFPTQNGSELDVTETGPDLGQGPVSLTEIENRVETYSVQLKHMCEERTKFRGYKNPDADPYLGYNVVDHIHVYEPVPRFIKVPWRGNPSNEDINYIDMPKIAERFNWEDYVDNLDVDEIWVWAYHNDVEGGVFGSESEMSSPTTPDISNSHYFTPESELPIYSRTYTVYGFNYGRLPSLHNQGHQLESIFAYIDRPMFIEKFVGSVGGNPPLGRCGDTHHPPNTTQDYDYLNPTLVQSDIEDWEPNGGVTKLVNVDTWGSIDYNWPYGNTPQAEAEINFYMYWMQNMPGYLNSIQYNENYMTNWWAFLSDWDYLMQNNVGLYGPSPSEISPTDNCIEDCLDSLYVTDQYIASHNYSSSDYLGSNAYISSNLTVDFHAEMTIEMGLGFEVEQGAVFHAEIEACQFNQN